MSETGYVYTLNDPRTDEPKYVGATKDPRKRFDNHKYGLTNDDVQEWLDELHADGEKPYMTIIRVAPLEELAALEEEVISSLRNEWNLFNKNDGGYSPRRQTAKTRNRTITVNETFEDDDFAKLKQVKGDRTWHRAFLEEFGVIGDE